MHGAAQRTNKAPLLQRGMRNAFGVLTCSASAGPPSMQGRASSLHVTEGENRRSFCRDQACAGASAHGSAPRRSAPARHAGWGLRGRACARKRASPVSCHISRLAAHHCVSQSHTRGGPGMPAAGGAHCAAVSATYAACPVTRPSQAPASARSSRQLLDGYSCSALAAWRCWRRARQPERQTPVTGAARMQAAAFLVAAGWRFGHKRSARCRRRECLAWDGC
jgi:hypothetical protein